jgi:hypothetical protein
MDLAASLIKMPWLIGRIGLKTELALVVNFTEVPLLTLCSDPLLLAVINHLVPRL